MPHPTQTQRLVSEAIERIRTIASEQHLTDVRWDEITRAATALLEASGGEVPALDLEPSVTLSACALWLVGAAAWSGLRIEDEAAKLLRRVSAGETPMPPVPVRLRTPFARFAPGMVCQAPHKAASGKR